MATCKDCVHVDVCEDLTRYKLSPKRAEELLSLLREKGKTCEHFKDRSRFVELPYKLGDSIYEPKRHQITEYQIARVVFYDFGLRMELRLMKGLLFRVEIKQEDIGKVVFLTREEAEQALKERENND